jgi:hypothetical protein
MRVDLRAVLCRCMPLGVLAVVWVAAQRDVIGIPPDPEWYISADGVVSCRPAKMVRSSAAQELVVPEAAVDPEDVVTVG